MPSRKGSRNKTYRGENHYTAKLTEKDVLLVDALLNEGLSVRKIAEKFDVSRHAIWCISNGMSWSHVTGINRY